MKIKPTFNIQHSTSNSEGIRAGNTRSFDVGRWELNVECSPFSRHPSRVTRHSHGVALIITLILLAVVTFMALTFLAVSRRERNAVTTTTDTASAQLAADDALAAAEGQIVANTLATTNPYNFGLLVSTNYINPYGFVAGAASFTNVNYYYPNGNPLNPNDFLQLMGNLFYLPRAPVYMSNFVTRAMENRFYLDLNRNGVDDPNGLVPEIGPTGLFIHPNGTQDSSSFNVVSNYQVGDPEWVGLLQHPDQPYGPNNLFVARYAFIAVPVGNALDLNAIHNQVLDESQPGFGNRGVQVNPPPGGVGNDTFLRNQGVGTWEINLAAFLADLNTNQWGQIVGSGAFPPPGSAIWYQYNEANPKPSVNSGHAFDDARALLAYRYGNNYLSLNPASRLFSNFGVLRFDNIDEYSDGPLQTTPAPINEAGLLANQDNPTLPWAGAANTNRFFSVDDLFDSGKEFNQEGISAAQIAAGNDFAGRLRATGTNYSTYNRYTYYRLLAQMGVDSTPEQGKLDLNYRNVDANGNVVPGLQTNLIPWTALQFFTNAADRMLRDYSQEWMVASPSNYVLTYGSFANISTAANPVLNPTNMPVPFGISHIPVLVNNQFVYTPAVQRVLQLAANIYDATTNNTFALGADFPSVFRPTFWVTRDPVSGYTNVYINGYQQVVSVIGTNDFQLNPPVDVTSLPLGLSAVNYSSYGGVNVYGVPWIIGAKKGFPNFNEFSMLTLVGVTRKLEVTRPSLDAPLSKYQTNQMYFMSISNSLGVECWNSYASNYFPSAAGLTIVAQDNLLMALNNRDRGTVPAFPLNPNPSFYPLRNAVFINGGNYWPGSMPWTMTSTTTAGPRLSPNSGSFDLPLIASVSFLTNSIYEYQGDNPAYNSTRLTDTFIPAEQDINNNYDYPDLGTPPLPQFDMVITNRLQVFMLDGNHVIDYVQFAGPDTITNLNAIIADASVTNFDNGLWNTNAITGLSNGTPYGVINQILNSLDPNTYGPNGTRPRVLTSDNGTWRDPQGGANVSEAVASFNAFFNENHTASYTYNQTRIPSGLTTNLDLSVQVPFTPTRYICGYTSWQANDPLVHYLASDLNFNGVEPGGLQTGWSQWNSSNAPPTNLGKLNDRYAPWGWNSSVPAGVFANTSGYDLAFKDPLVRSSDNWDFPTYKFPTVGWLGRVHRGTPWQTVYLKATNVLQEIQMLGRTPINIGTNTWAQWTGDTQFTYGQNYDAANTAPVQDRLLFDVFSTAPNDNATLGQLSVNVGAGDPSPQAGLAAWSALFSGVEVLSNNVPTATSIEKQVFLFVPRYQNPLPGELPPSLTNFVINPAGPAGLNSALGQLVAGINQTRTNFVNRDGLAGSFERAGDILAVPQLTAQSPFLNWNDTAQQTNGISDEMYEWLPQQVMSLVHVADTPRYVIYSYGQTLKPAPNGINTANITLANGQSAFGMVTNYQVVAEAATRAVVRFDGTRVDNIVVTNVVPGVNRWMVAPFVNNTHAVIEQFNVLPAD